MTPRSCTTSTLSFEVMQIIETPDSVEPPEDVHAPGQVQHGQRRVAAASSQLLRRSSARPNQAIDPDRSSIPHSEL